MRGNYSGDEDPTKPFCWADGWCNASKNSDASEADLWICWHNLKSECITQDPKTGAMHPETCNASESAAANSRLHLEIIHCIHPAINLTLLHRIHHLHHHANHHQVHQDHQNNQDHPRWNGIGSITPRSLFLFCGRSWFVHRKFLSSSGRLINLSLSSKSLDHRRMFHLSQKILNAWKSLKIFQPPPPADV